MTGTKKRRRTTPALPSVHWLPVLVQNRFLDPDVSFKRFGPTIFSSEVCKQIVPGCAEVQPEEQRGIELLQRLPLSCGTVYCCSHQILWTFLNPVLKLILTPRVLDPCEIEVVSCAL